MKLQEPSNHICLESSGNKDSWATFPKFLGCMTSAQIFDGHGTEVWPIAESLSYASVFLNLSIESGEISGKMVGVEATHSAWRSVKPKKWRSHSVWLRSHTVWLWVETVLGWVDWRSSPLWEREHSLFSILKLYMGYTLKINMHFLNGRLCIKSAI